MPIGAARGPFWPLPDDTVFFYSVRRGDPEYRGLSNFAHAGFRAPHPLLPDHSLVEFATVEHYFNAQKTLDLDDFEWIRTAPDATTAKRRGSKWGEGGRRITLRSDWEHRHRYHVMLEALRYKFALPEFVVLLDSTGDRTLAEDSPRDYEWGCRDERGGYEGRNLLGRALMRVRAERREAAALTSVRVADTG